MNKLRWLQMTSITALLFLGILCILKIWGYADWKEQEFQLMGTLGVIFVVSGLSFELLRKENKK